MKKANDGLNEPVGTLVITSLDCLIHSLDIMFNEKHFLLWPI